MLHYQTPSIKTHTTKKLIKIRLTQKKQKPPMARIATMIVILLKLVQSMLFNAAFSRYRSVVKKMKKRMMNFWQQRPILNSHPR